MLRQSPTQFPSVKNRINASHDLTYTGGVICILLGAPIGIAIDISLACNMRLTAQDAKFNIKVIDIGLAADLGTLQHFPQIVGNDSWRKELAFTSHFFSATKALEKPKESDFPRH